VSDDLQPLEPETAVEMYLDERRSELSEKSVENHTYRLRRFVEWCDQEDIDNLNELTGRDLHRFRHYRSEDVATTTLRTHLATLRVFLEFCARIDAVPEGMREKVLLPELDDGEDARDVQLHTERASEILTHLDRFEYATREHVIMALLWHTGIRLGTLRAFDVDDFDPETPALTVRHRPETDTPLKNKTAAERTIAVGPYYRQVLEDYIEHNRPAVEDEHGREPLIASTQGRFSDTAVRNVVYRCTRPCMVEECPHDRDPATCEAMEPDHASNCPSSRSPHGVRRGSITHHLREGTPEEVVSDRMNVSSEVLERHYDRRTEREKMELRREFLDDVWSDDDEH
jgi:site-specific recombinase XerD